MNWFSVCSTLTPSVTCRAHQSCRLGSEHQRRDLVDPAVSQRLLHDIQQPRDQLLAGLGTLG